MSPASNGGTAVVVPARRRYHRGPPGLRRIISTGWGYGVPVQVSDTWRWQSDPAEVATGRLGPDLGWLASLLWPDADVRLSPTAPPPGRRVAEAYAVLPSAVRPSLLVPLSWVGRVDAGTEAVDSRASTVARARRAVASLAARRLGRSRPPELVVYLDREPRPDELLTHHLRGVFDRPDVALAVSFPPPGPGRTLSFRVVTLDGEVLGFGKVGWNGPTRAFVTNEAAVLRRWARRGPRSFSVPDLLYEGRWRDHIVTVTSPIPREPRSMLPGRVPPIDVTREIAQSGGIALMQLGSTPWWRSILARGFGGPASVVLEWMNELHGRRVLWHGTWHGDWRPENVSTDAAVPHVWRWERSCDSVPVGLDCVHFALRIAMGRRHAAADASRAAIGRSAAALRAMGIPRDDDPLLVACVVAEVLLRVDAECRAGGVDGCATRDGLLADLRRWVGRA